MTKKHVMSNSLKPVDIVAPEVVLDDEFDFDVGERIRPSGEFYSVLRIC